MKLSIFFLLSIANFSVLACNDSNSNAGDDPAVDDDDISADDDDSSPPDPEPNLFETVDVQTSLNYQQITGTQFQFEMSFIGGEEGWDFTQYNRTLKLVFVAAFSPLADVTIETAGEFPSDYELRIDETVNDEYDQSAPNSRRRAEVMIWFPAWEVIKPGKQYNLSFTINFEEERPDYMIHFYMESKQHFEWADDPVGTPYEGVIENVHNPSWGGERSLSHFHSISNNIKNALICEEGLHWESVLGDCRGLEYDCRAYNCYDGETLLRESIYCDLDGDIREKRYFCGCPEQWAPEGMSHEEWREAGGCDDLPPPLD